MSDKSQALISGMAEIRKLAGSLYLSRPVANADQIIEWAKSQGFPSVMEAGSLHCTLVFCPDAIEWDALGVAHRPHTSHGGAREVCRLGDGGAVVLKFEDAILDARWKGLMAAGAKSDYPTFTPHVTISWSVPEDFDLSKVKPFAEPIEFGPEVFMPVQHDWKASIVEKARVAKVDEELGIVFGWAIICSIDGEDYYDLNIDRDGPLQGQRVPEHITQKAMLRACIDFMKTARPGNEMHKGPDKGQFVCAFPLTDEIKKSFDIECPISGLLVGYAPPPDLLAKFKSGEMRGFSIEGWRGAGREIVE